MEVCFLFLLLLWCYGVSVCVYECVYAHIWGVGALYKSLSMGFFTSRPYIDLQRRENENALGFLASLSNPHLQMCPVP